MEYISDNVQDKSDFDYDSLPQEKRAVIHQWAIEIKERLRHTALIVWEIGERLVQVRSQLESREFCLWLKLEFGWSQRTAYNFINVYKAFPNFANFAKIEIPISSLYLLAAPSTPQEIRTQVLNRAIAGENISYKAIQEAIKQGKQKNVDNGKLITTTSLFNKVHSEVEDSLPENRKFLQPQQSLRVYPKLDLSGSEIKTADLKPLVSASEQVACNINTSYSNVRPGWNKIQRAFQLFWGDTASADFIQCLPQEAFILAIPSSEWRHNCLLNNSRNFIILYQSPLNEELINSLLSEFSQRHKAVILPWLPNWKTIELALKHNITVYAGDSNLNCCETVISQLEFKVLERVTAEA